MDETGSLSAALERIQWLERIGCCSQGHTTIPQARRGRRLACCRYDGNPTSCNATVVLVRDYPAVLTMMLMAYVNDPDRRSTPWTERDVFDMLKALKAWGDLDDVDQEPAT